MIPLVSIIQVGAVMALDNLCIKHKPQHRQTETKLGNIFFAHPGFFAKQEIFDILFDRGQYPGLFHPGLLLKRKINPLRTHRRVPYPY